MWCEYPQNTAATERSLLITKIIFAMYHPETDIAEVSLANKIHASFDYQKCNTKVHLNEPSDVAYLTSLAREEPGCMPSWLLRMVGYKGIYRRWGNLIRGSHHNKYNLLIISSNIGSIPSPIISSTIC